MLILAHMPSHPLSRPGDTGISGQMENAFSYTIELMHMLRKGQLEGDREQGRSAAEQFYALAA
jgi:hypothetical protein